MRIVVRCPYAIVCALLAFCLPAVMYLSVARVRQSPPRGWALAGPSCAHIAIHHSCQLLGIPLDMNDLLAKMPPQTEGHTLSQMRSTLRWIGVESQGRQLTYPELARSTTPVIAHFPDHFVVVENAGEMHVRLLDGIGRRRVMGVEEFKRYWSGNALVLYRPGASLPLPAFMDSALWVGAPRIRFDTLRLDAGEIVEAAAGDRVRFSFLVRNLGSADLKIERIRTNCRCAVVNEVSPTIRPGSFETVNIDYLIGENPGVFKHVVFIESNDPVFPVLELSIAGNTSRSFFFEPHVLCLGQVTKGSIGQGKARLYFSGDIPLKPLATSSDAHLQVQAIPLTKALACSIFKLPGRPKPAGYKNLFLIRGRLRTHDLPVGRYDATIALSTGLDSPRTIPLKVRAEVVDRAQLSPARVILGLIEEGRRIEKETRIKMRDGSSFKITHVANPIPGLECAVAGVISNEAVLLFTFTPRPPTKLIDENVTLEYEITGETRERGTVKVPVYGYAPGGG